MPQFVQKIVFASFVIFAALLIGCSDTDRVVSGSRVAKPLVTPEATAVRPKIVAFGDSLTAGFGLTEKESYPYLLQQRLNADRFNYEVVNAGVSGDTSLGGLERIDWVLEDARVEILILELGANDLLRGLSPTKMKANLETIITKAKSKNIKVLLCGMLAPPTLGAEYQRQFT
ncbi:MAG: arylesterase, partial [Acidobacteria bacterium]|nr:arylesterase [Acidobacteriota bacterium]